MKFTYSCSLPADARWQGTLCDRSNSVDPSVWSDLHFDRKLLWNYPTWMLLPNLQEPENLNFYYSYITSKLLH